MVVQSDSPCCCVPPSRLYNLYVPGLVATGNIFPNVLIPSVVAPGGLVILRALPWLNNNGGADGWQLLVNGLVVYTERWVPSVYPSEKVDLSPGILAPAGARVEVQMSFTQITPNFDFHLRGYTW